MIFYVLSSLSVKAVSETVLLTALALNFASNLAIVGCGAVAYCGRHIVRDFTASYGQSLGLCFNGFVRGLCCGVDQDPERRYIDEDRRSKQSSLIDSDLVEKVLDLQRKSNQDVVQLVTGTTSQNIIGYQPVSSSFSNDNHEESEEAPFPIKNPPSSLAASFVHEIEDELPQT